MRGARTRSDDIARRYAQGEVTQKPATSFELEQGGQSETVRGNNNGTP
jgi:hypothetical protein